MKVVSRTIVAVLGLALAVTASAQITAPLPINSPGNLGPNALFPKQNINGPTGVAQQVNYPYEGQCLALSANAKYFPLLPLCQATNPAAPGYAPSFACPSGRTAGGWDACGTATTGSVVAGFKELAPNMPPVAFTPAAGMFKYDLLNPPAYAPDTTTFPGADFYEIKLHEAWGYDILKTVKPTPTTTAFPNPGIVVPNGKQWTGLVCSPLLPATTCTGGVAAGAPLLTPVWGVGSSKNFLTLAGQTPSAWSANDYLATWPSISVWATKGRPVVVKWVNEFPNQHVFCPHPEAADWPCAIDRTFMGVKSKIDPALATANVPGEGVNEFGSPQQPDNSWVTHLHGADTPPSTDGFAEKWFGNSVTAAKWAGVSGNYVSPPFENPSGLKLQRPAGRNWDLYTYPMNQDEATIWFHDHTLGKTHHNVIAGPAGFFPITDLARHAPGGDLAWLNELSPLASAKNKDALGAPLYDLYLAIQDRAFNDDGSINFSNGLGQPAPAGAVLPIGYSSVTVGANPQVHPTWIPEYFGDHALVNGVLWPKKAVDRGWYRMRIVDGSDSRCWTLGFATVVPTPGMKPTNDVPFYVLANDQGYLKNPVLAPMNQFTMCPGERYEILVNFGAANIPLNGAVTMTNTAPAPFPAGIVPYANKGPYMALAVVMQFQVVGSGVAGAVPVTSANNPAFVNPALQTMAFQDIRPVGGVVPAGSIVRQVYMNERADGVTLSPMGMQLNGVPFEYKVTETPKKGSREFWQFVNLTVDAHPMHPHLVKHQIVWRQTFNVGAYKALLCGSSTCQPGTAPGNEMQVVPDVTALLGGNPALVTAASVEGGWKDASQVPPGMVTMIVADWKPGWAPIVADPKTATAPGTFLGLNDVQCNPNPAPFCTPPPVGYTGPFMPGSTTCMCVVDPATQPPAPGPLACLIDPITLLPTPIMTQPTQPAACQASTWTYEDATTGPYVWHCHINSHEDSEMMRTSLVVP